MKSLPLLNPGRTGCFVGLVGALLSLATIQGPASAAERYAIFKSTDRGVSWSRADAGIPNRYRINAFGSLDDTLIVGTDSGIFVSSDEAGSWRPAVGAGTNSGRTLSLATFGGTAFAGTDRIGVLVSSDKGSSWTVMAGSPSSSVRCLLVHQDRLYVGTDAEGVFVSGNGGQAWTRLRDGLPGNSQVFALAAHRGRLFAGLYSKGLHGWSDPEQSWKRLGLVTPLALASVDDTLIVGHNPGGVHRSDDLGTTWSRGLAVAFDSPQVGVGPSESGELSLEAPVWELASGDRLALAGASDGVFRSEDRGLTWTRARAGLPPRSPGVSFLVRRGLVLAGVQVYEEDNPAGASKENRQLRPATPAAN